MMFRIPIQDGKFHAPPAAATCNLCFPYLGQLPLAANYGDLSLSDYLHGTWNQKGFIEWVIQIFDDQLHVSASYEYPYFSLTLMSQGSLLAC